MCTQEAQFVCEDVTVPVRTTFPDTKMSRTMRGFTIR